MHAASERKLVSVVLPTYNEAQTIVRVLSEIIAVLSPTPWRYEVIVVDDQSPDGTAQRIVDAFSENSHVTVLRRSGLRGLAFSLRDGLTHARGAILVVMDADFNHDPKDLPRLIRYAGDFDLVSGSRFVAGGGMYSRTRQFGSSVMNVLVRVVLRTRIRDNLAGYFAMRRELFCRLPAEQIFWGYGDYFFRLLFHAERVGATILEIPVVYRQREGGQSKTRFLQTTARYAWEALRLGFSR